MDKLQNVQMEEMSLVLDVLMEPSLFVVMELLGLHALIGLSQHVRMELCLENLHAVMEIVQLVLMEQLLEDQVEGSVTVVANLNALMEIALYVQMEQKVPHVPMVASQYA